MKDLVQGFKSPISILLLFGSLLVGLFNEPAGVLISLILGVGLFISIVKNGEIKISASLTTIAVAIISFGYLVTAFWGVDKFYSLLGFGKYFALILFWLCISQGCDRDRVLSIVPITGAFMTVVSAVLMNVKSLEAYFSVSGRIAGFFQYPNTFALFLIIGIVLIAMSDRMTIANAIVGAVLVVGVFLTGSRTSFIVLVATIIAIVILSKNRGMKIFVLVATVVVAIAGVIYFSITGVHGAIGRFMTISLSSGTLLGRLLYFKDAIRVIIRHPFGLGYMGYYFSQGSFQTGVYANEFVHNELLQILLDIGWIPAIVGIGAIIKSLLSKNVDRKYKLVVLVILAHSLLDFDMQFLVIDFILLLCLDFTEEQKVITLSKANVVISSAIMVLLLFIGVYTGISSSFFLANKPEVASKICKYNTMAQIEVLKNTEDADVASNIAECIIANDKKISNAYSSLAFAYYMDGDIQKTIDYKMKAIECNRYFVDEYLDTIAMLVDVTNQYLDMGDYDSAQYCMDRILEIEGILNSVKLSTDEIAYKLNDKPNLDLPEDYVEILDEIHSQY